MKKFLALICTIACIFGLTACGGEENLTAYEQLKVSYAQQNAEYMVVNVFAPYFDDAAVAEFDEYTAEEIEYILATGSLAISADGYAYVSAMKSYNSAASSMGQITGVSGSTAVIDGDQIIVEVDVIGQDKNATAEFIFSNDMFLRLESASISPSSGLGELMGKAALNTLIGMGTVFVVLILISLIISCFKMIPKLQENAAKKKAAKAGSPVDSAVSQIVEQEEEAAADGMADDLELIAVISAAIAASEGAASADGFVVRSIRRR